MYAQADRFIDISIYAKMIGCRIPSDRNPYSEQAQMLRTYFQELAALLRKDEPPMWGINLYGPILIVNPESRIFFANENNLTQSFQEIQGVYVDTLIY